eukprot:GILJ01009069.1.p1 GENE.GILJ01009069.1~~GILJ01009069.1.p1  ORF type:complete len:522 (-),score=50.46 GILJ01009069.1:50-1615(-)
MADEEEGTSSVWASSNVFVLVGLAASFFICYAYAMYKHRPVTFLSTHVRYGFPAYSVASLLCRLGFSLAAIRLLAAGLLDLIGADEAMVETVLKPDWWTFYLLYLVLGFALLVAVPVLNRTTDALHEMAKRNHLITPSRVLLLGTQTGALSARASRLWPDSSIISIDPWLTDLLPMTETWARRNLSLEHIHNVEVEYADARELPYPTNHFDVVIFPPMTLSQYREAFYVLAEAFRVLKPHGTFLIWNSLMMGNAVENGMKSVGFEQLYAQMYFAVPFPMKLYSAVKPASKTVPTLSLNALAYQRKPLTPLADVDCDLSAGVLYMYIGCGMFSVCIAVGCFVILRYLWSTFSVPTSMTVHSRLSGMFVDEAVFFILSLVEGLAQIYLKCKHGGYTTAKDVIVVYIKLFLGAIFGSFLWSLITSFLPSVVVQLLIAPLLSVDPQLLSTVISICMILFVTAKSSVRYRPLYEAPAVKKSKARTIVMDDSYQIYEDVAILKTVNNNSFAAIPSARSSITLHDTTL